MYKIKLGVNWLDSDEHVEPDLSQVLFTHEFNSEEAKQSWLHDLATEMQNFEVKKTLDIYLGR